MQNFIFDGWDAGFEAALGASLRHLNQMLKNRFGNSVTFIKSKDAENRFDENLIQGGHYFYADSSAYLPIFIEEKLLGILQINEQEKIKTKDREQLLEVIGMTVEQRLTNKISTNKITTNTQEVPTYNNVVQLRPFREVQNPVLNKFKEKNQLNFSFLIEGQDSEEIFKMALEVHERSNRVAFVGIEDFSPDTFTNPTQIHALGPTTVFIRDILALPFSIQRGLERYFESERAEGSPQFISGCTLPLSELKNDPRILNTLLPTLSAGYLRMTQPFSFYRKENLLDFFYDSLTGRLT